MPKERVKKKSRQHGQFTSQGLLCVILYMAGYFMY